MKGNGTVDMYRGRYIKGTDWDDLPPKAKALFLKTWISVDDNAPFSEARRRAMAKSLTIGVDNRSLKTI